MNQIRTRRRPARLAGPAIAAALLMASVTVLGASNAVADDGPSVPPGTEADSVPPVNIDPKNPGLKMPEGGTLAPAKVLDIVQVVEDEGGDERREDSNANTKFALQSEVLFSKDSAKLSPAAHSRISAIVAEIKKRNATKVRVFGFTDNLGSAAHGDVLSKQRANAVQSVLAKELDSNVTFDIRGYGEQFPVASNSTEEGRKKNRRVEVSFPNGTPS